MLGREMIADSLGRNSVASSQGYGGGDVRRDRLGTCLIATSRLASWPESWASDPPPPTPRTSNVTGGNAAVDKAPTMDKISRKHAHLRKGSVVLRLRPGVVLT